MHVRQLPSGNWRCIVKSRGIKDSATFPTEREAKLWGARREVEIADGTYVKKSASTVTDWFREWLSIVEPDLERSSFQQYEQHVRLHLEPRIGTVKLSDLRPAHVQRLYTDLQREHSAPMASKIATTFKHALKTATALQLIATNPAREVKKPRASASGSDQGQTLKVWNRDQVKSVLSAIRGHRFEALFVLALDTGMRQGELFALHWPEVDLAAGTVQVIRSLESVTGAHGLKKTKTSASRRTLRINSRTRDLLAELPKSGPANLVFSDTRGGFLRKSNFHRNQWKPLIAKAQVPHIPFHGLRHTCATQLLAAGVNIKAVSARLGHATVKITLDTYSHFLPEMEDTILAATSDLTDLGDTPTIVER